jgi:hypothetical protein
VTTQSDFKARVRARMARTGERYAAARATLISQATHQPGPTASSVPLLPGYDMVGGIHAESATLANVLRHAGVVAPHTGQPFEESFLFGLAGGIGFMYFAFEYANAAPMLSVVLRSDSYPDAFVRRGLERSGAELDWHETGSAAQAVRHLDEALEHDRAAICVTDMTGLPWYGMPVEYRGFAPHYVAVIGVRDDEVAIDDRAARPLILSRAALADARAGYRKGKHRLVTVRPAPPVARQDPAGVVLDAIGTTARGFHEAPHAGFGSNFGVRGLEKWARLIGDARDAKGWHRMLGEGRDLAAALTRMYEGIEVEFTPPAGGRPLYADFLDEAAAIVGRPGLEEAAVLYREAAAGWQAFARASLPEAEPTLDAIRRLVDQRIENMDALGEAAAQPNRAARADIDKLQAGFSPDAATRSDLLAELAARASALLAVEQRALSRLETALA